MPQFRYTARDSAGKLVEGLIDSNDRTAAIHQIEKERRTPIKITPVSGDSPGDAPAATAASAAATSGNGTKPGPSGPVQRLSHTHLYLFTEQLAHLLVAGMTLDEALGILVRRLKHPRLGGLSQSLHRALVDGRSLSQAMREYPRIFSPLYVNMVSAGEASGALPEILRRLVIYLADVKALRDRVQQALLYPAVLVVAGIGLIIVFMTVMVPQLTNFFKESGGTLPVPTRVLLEANRLITHYWWVAVLAGGAIYGAFKVFTRTAEGLHAWHTFVWKVPLISVIIRYRFYAQFARTLGTLIANGVTLLRALELLEEISGNEYIRRKMVDVRRAVVDGATLSTALTEQKMFPELFLDMMAVGEQTGKFGDTMQMIADVYERELDKQVKVVSALIPPLIMLVIATVVGLVVFGILSAVFGLTKSLRPGMH
jgi:type II secretory pathway component PulF